MVDALADDGEFKPSTPRLVLSLLHSTLGICAEVAAELTSVKDPINLKEELGDASWYTAEGLLAIAALLGYVSDDGHGGLLIAEGKVDPLPIWECPLAIYDIPVCLPTGRSVRYEAQVYHQRLAACAGRLADTVKAFVYYGKKETHYFPDKSDEKRPILEVALLQLRAVAGSIEAWANAQAPDWDFEDMQTANLNKLKARYPDKFSEHSAEHRDLDKERAALQG